jgi:2-keto-3-deoxy-L-rhamnonate aldolase RhmA
MSFIKKIQNNPPAIGTLVTLDSPEVVEILCLCKFDWLFFDMEHGVLSVASVQHLIQSMTPECYSIVRIPENSSVWIKKVLDTGCDGILVPQVKNADEARSAVMAAKFPPQGERSVGISRAHGYGMSFPEYVKNANEIVSLIIQIEHIDAVNNLDEILNVDGIDGVFIGPYDLSGSMNCLGDITNDKVQDAVREIKRKCADKQIPIGIFVMKGESAPKEIEDGCQFIAIGIDTTLLWNAAQNQLKSVRPA